MCYTACINIVQVGHFISALHYVTPLPPHLHYGVFFVSHYRHRDVSVFVLDHPHPGHDASFVFHDHYLHLRVCDVFPCHHLLHGAAVHVHDVAFHDLRHHDVAFLYHHGDEVYDPRIRFLLRH